MTVIHYNNCYRCGFGIAARANVDDSNSGYTLSVCAVAGLQTCNQDNEDNYLAFLLGGQNYPDGVLFWLKPISSLSRESSIPIVLIVKEEPSRVILTLRPPLDELRGFRLVSQFTILRCSLVARSAGLLGRRTLASRMWALWNEIHSAFVRCYSHIRPAPGSG